MKKILSFDESLNLSHKQTVKYYKNYINKGLATAFRILGLNILDIKSAKGCTLELSNGDKILDLTSGIGVLALGHNHQKIIDVERKFQDLCLVDTQKFGPNKLQAALAYNLSKLLPDDLEVTFFAVSGAEAVEAAIKLSTMAKGKDAKYFISAQESYHGKTLGALSLTDTENFSEGFHLGLREENTVKIEYNNIEAYKKIILKLTKEKICAIIIEPIQGQIVEVAKKEYLREICNISKKNNIIVIFDEIKCGLGRSGDLFSFLDYDCVPDILTISKALGGGKNAISAMVASKKIFNKAYGSINKSTLHTTTFFGLGEACASGIETLNIISDEGFLENIKKKSKFTFQELNKIKNKYPKYIKSIKGKGLFIGVEFDFDNIISKVIFKKIRIPFIKNIKTILMGAIVREYLHEHKILLHFNNSQPETLVFLPPLIISNNEIEQFLNATQKILEKGLIKIFSKFVIGNLKI
jgi:putrescine aminotransferase|tara:strand:- start:92 stop:1495 length:1404 start_codon:yes stop_codon:yes gene_type:complete